MKCLDLKQRQVTYKGSRTKCGTVENRAAYCMVREWDITDWWDMHGRGEDEGHFRQRAELAGFLEKGTRRLKSVSVHLQEHPWHSRLMGHGGKGKRRRQTRPLSILVESAVPMFLNKIFYLNWIK